MSIFQDNFFGILGALISMLCFGLADSLWKIPVQAFGALRSVLFRNVFVVLFVLPYFLWGYQEAFVPLQAVLATFLISLFSYLGLYFFAKSIKNGLTSVMVPVTGLNTLVTLLISIFSHDPGVNWIVGGGVLFAFSGLFLLNINLKDGRFRLVFQHDKGLKYALACALCWGISFAYSYFAVAFTGPVLFTILQEVTILCLALIHFLIAQLFLLRTENPYAKGLNVFDISLQAPQRFGFSPAWRQNWLIYVLIGILGGVGAIFNVSALDKASINTVTGLVCMAPVISVLFGQLYYGEKLTGQQKSAVFLIICGVFLISYFRYY